MSNPTNPASRALLDTGASGSHRWVTLPARFRWETREKPIFDDGLWAIFHADRLEQLPICTVDRGDDHDELARRRAEVYARFIVRAVNSHHELLETLKRIRSGIEDGSLGESEMHNLADDAIAKAEGSA